MVAELSRLPSGDVQSEATAARLVITRLIMIALPAQPALSRDQQEQPTSPPALHAALAPTRQKDPLPAPPCAQLGHTSVGRVPARHVPPARPLLLLARRKIRPARCVQLGPFPCRHGHQLLV